MSDPASGQFIWYELMTQDAGKALAFYTEVVGWTASNAGMEGGDYMLLSVGGVPVAGAMAMPEHSLAAGAPAGWRGYIAVDDTDAAVARVSAAGGQLRFGPQDIPGVGRVASMQDPQGAPIVLMTPAPSGANPRHAPFTPGTFGWNELYAADGPSAFDFYAAMFGWTAGEAIDMKEMGKYQIFETGGTRQGGGILTRFDKTQPPRWVYYINTDSIQAAIERVKKAGGQVLLGPQIVPGGSWIMHGLDPTGAMFAMVAQAK